MTRTTFGLAALAALAFAAPAAAAPDHTFVGSETDAETFEWTSLPGAGLSDLSDQLGCNEGANCDQMLFEVQTPGIFTIKTTGNEQTLVDGDFDLFASDADGTPGRALGGTTAFTPNETISLEVEPGFYLMQWYYSGVGSYDGAATWKPLPPEEEIPEEEL
jgi:hypothetical protein